MDRRRRLAWWAALLTVAAAGLVLRGWNLDFDQRQHQHPDERYWSLVSADLARADTEQPPPDYPTVFGPVLDWLDAARSPANPYRATDSFVYGPAPLAWARGLAGWLAEGVADGDQPAHAITSVIDALGVPLLDASGAARFDDGYQVDLIGRLLAALFDTVTIVVVGLVGRRLGALLAGDGRAAAAGLAAAGFYAVTPIAVQQAHFLSSEAPLTLAAALTLLAALRLDRGADPRRAARGGLALGAAAGAVVALKLSGAALAVVPLAGCAGLAWRHRRRADYVRLGCAVVAAGLAFRALHPAAFDGLGLSFAPAFTDDLDRLRHQYDQDAPPSIQWAGRTGAWQAARWLFTFCFGPGMCLAAAAGAARLWRSWRRWPVAVVGAAVVVPFAYVVALAVPSGRYFMVGLPALAALAGVGAVAAWHGVRWPAVGRSLGVVTLGLGVLWGLMFVRGVYGGEYTRTAASHWLADHTEPGDVLSVQLWDDALPLAVDGIDPSAFTHEQLELVWTDSVDKVVRTASQLERIDYVVESSPRLWGTVGAMPNRFPSTIRFFQALDDGSLGFERVATFDADPRLGPLRLDDAGAEEAFSVYDHPEVRIWRKVRDVPRAGLLDALDPVAAANAATFTYREADSGGLLLEPAERAALDATPTWEESFADGPGWLHALAWLVVFELLGLATFVLLLPLMRRLPDAGWGIAKPLGLAGPATGLFVADEWLGLPTGRATVAALVAALVGGAGWFGWGRRAELAALWRTRRNVVLAVESIGLLAFALMLALRAANPDLWHPTAGGEKPFELAYLSSVLRTPGWPPYDPWFSGGAMNYYYGGYLQLVTPARLWATSPALAVNIGLAVYASCAAAAAATVGGWLAGRQRAVVGAVAGTFVVVGANLAVVPEAWRRATRGGQFDWWSVSRVVPGRTDITEFPAWSFLFADLHPHLMAQSLVLTAIVMWWVVYRALVGGRGWPLLVLAGGLTGGLAGLIRATNTWDLPIVLAGAVGALLLGYTDAATPPRRRAVRAGVTLAAVLAGAFGVWRPYAGRGQVFDGGVVRARWHTPLGAWLTHWGWFAAATVLALAWLVDWRAASARIGRGRPIRLVGGTAVAAMAAGAVVIWPWAPVLIATATLAALSSATAWVRRREQVGPALALVGMGWVVQAGVELVTVRNDIDRMNTVFKFWFESWLLLGCGSAALVVALAAERGWPRWPARGLAAAATAVAVVFWALAVPSRVDDRVSGGGWSLDGERYLSDPTEAVVTTWSGKQVWPADDLGLAEWLRRHAPGGSVVAEASGDDYQWTSRMTWLTGLPTPSGWWFHSTQQRRAYAAAVDARRADLRSLYTTADPVEAARILATYGVDYVLYGTVERALGGAPALVDSGCLDRSFTDGAGWIATVDQQCAYQIWRDALADAVDAG